MTILFGMAYGAGLLLLRFSATPPLHLVAELIFEQTTQPAEFAALDFLVLLDVLFTTAN